MAVFSSEGDLFAVAPLENPGMAHRALRDHHAVAAGVPLDALNVGHALDVAVADDGKLDRLLDLGDGVPVRRVRIVLHRASDRGRR